MAGILFAANTFAQICRMAAAFGSPTEMEEIPVKTIYLRNDLRRPIPATSQRFKEW
jgi:hypothetical protein